MTNEELRPLTIGQLLDKTFRLSLKCIIKNIVTHLIFGGIMIGALVACGVVIAVLSASSMLVTPGYNYEVVMVVMMILIMLIFTPITIVWYSILFDMQIKGYLNERWRLKSHFKPVFRKFWIIIGAGLLSIPIIALGYVALFIGVIGSFALLCSVMPVIIYEDLGPLKAIKRSFKLTSYSFWTVTGQMGLFMVITFGFLFILNGARMVPTYLISAMNLSGLSASFLYLTIAALSFLYIMFSCFTYILGVTFYTLIYFNQRIKFENFGMEMMAEEMVKDLNSDLMFSENSQINSPDNRNNLYNSNIEGDPNV